MRLFVNNDWDLEIVDDRIPLVGGIPLFGKTNTNDVWMWLYEKAWVKHKGTLAILSDEAESVLAIAGRPVFMGWTATRAFADLPPMLAVRSSKQEIRNMGLIPGCLYHLARICVF